MSEETPKAGVYYNDPKDDNQFEWKLGRISIQLDTFGECVRWAKEQELVNKSGYINFELLMSKAGKKYVKLDTWKPKVQDEAQSDDEVALPF